MSRPLVSDTIARLQPYRPGRSVEEIARELGLEEVLKLASNENPLGPSPAAVEAIANAARQIHRYPDEGAWEAREAIAAFHGVLASQIVLGAGSTDLLELIVRTFTTQQDHALVSAGSFVAYRLFLHAAGTPFTEVPLAAGCAVDLPAMARAVRPDTRLVFLANPNNPTGTRFTAPELDSFLAAIPDDVLVVLDDAYVQFADPGMPDSVAVMRRRPRTIVARSFSKAYGLAGLRCGYGICAEEVASWLVRVRRPFAVGRLAMAAAKAALHDTEHLERTLSITREGRKTIFDELCALGLSPIPSQTNFVAADLGSDERAHAIAEALLKLGLIVRPVSSFGLPRYLRMSVGTPVENRRLIDGFAMVLREFRM